MARDGTLGGVYDCDTITEPEAFFGLQPEWNALWAATPGSYVAESFAWARLCWSHPPKHRSRALSCLAVRAAGSLIAVWPLVTYRQAAWRVGTPLISATEYCPFLIHPQADPVAVWEAVSAALSRSAIDALRLLNVRRDGALGLCLARHSAPATELYTSELMSLDSTDLADWEAYRARWSAKTRQSLNRARRRFQAAASVVFEDVCEPVDRAAAWRWMLEQKREWARRRDLDNGWLFSDSFDRFIAAGLDTLGPIGARRLFVLKADGEFAAAELVSIDGTRMESFMSVYNEAFTEFSPANLLHEDCIRWAGTHGLAYDMRLGARRQKESWAARPSQAVSYAIPLSAHGALFTACLRLAASGREREDVEAA
jgi:CelD/BcsL family acetyltransferase involved in cellulose biosynthesis